MIRPPPTSPLFPYTTLFRSRSRSRAVHAPGVSRRRSEPVVRRLLCAARRGGGARRRGRTRARLDRKSTRLNSSHLVISYAVFCLKQKNALVTAARAHTGRWP